MRPNRKRGDYYAQHRAFVFAAQPVGRRGGAGGLGRLPPVAPCPCAQPVFVLAVAGRGTAVRAALWHSACPAPPAKYPTGRGRRHCAGPDPAGAYRPGPACHGSRRPRRACALVHHTDRVASAGGGMGCGRGTAGRACRVGLPAPVPPGGAGLQNAGWLLQRPLCAHTLYPGPAAAPHLPARRAGRPRPGRRPLARAHPHPPGRPADQAAVLRRGLPALVQPAGVAGLPRV